MMEALERLKEELDMFPAESNATITVSRKDLEALINAYEVMKEKAEKR